MSSKDKQPPKAEAAKHFHHLGDLSSNPSGLPPLVPVRSDSNPALRQQAEEVLRNLIAQSQEHIDSLSPETLRMILHELRVHQIELEMQNEELRRSQAELADSRARYFSLYDLAPVSYLTVNEPGLIVEANLTASTLLGLPRPELVTHPLSHFIPEEDQDNFYRHRKLVLETGEPQSYELRMARADGTAFWAQLEATAAKDAGGAPVCRIVFSDISARKRAEEALQASESRGHAITDSAQDAIIMMDPRGAISYWNPAAESIFGYSSEEAIGKNLHDLLVPEPFLSDYHAAYPEFQRTGRGHAVGKTIEMSACRKDGREITTALSLSAIALKGEWHAVGIVRDVSERKAMEAHLREALERAEASVRAKSEFLAVMSHELRTPLNGMLGFAELLSFSKLDDDQKDYVQTIQSSGSLLLAVVNDVLDFSSIEKGTLTMQVAPLAVAGLVEEAVATARAAAAEKGLSFRCEVAAGVPDEITGDKHRILQILINLLGNGIKFTATGSVALRVATSSAGARPALDFSVEDTGIGISDETLGRLFKPFTQGDSTFSRQFGGTGLGLAISKRLAEAMGGSITVTSTPAKGSTFTFILPFEIPPSNSGSGTLPLCQDEPGARTPLPRAPVLVAEDDQTCIALVAKILQSLGYSAEFVTNGVEAVKAFVPGKFSAILMDVLMPVKNGLEATRAIRALESGSRVPIIAFTANAMPGDRERCLAAGMDDFLSKPFKKDELAAKLACVRSK